MRRSRSDGRPAWMSWCCCTMRAGSFPHVRRTTSAVSFSQMDAAPPTVEARRLMGPNLFSSRMGAVLEVEPDADRAEAIVLAWVHFARGLSAAIGWPDPEIHVRTRRTGVSLYLSAPIDGLMTATDVAEEAYALAQRGTRERQPGAIDADAIARVSEAAGAEQRSQSNLAALYSAAVARGTSAIFDDDTFTIGSGRGACSWPL